MVRHRCLGGMCTFRSVTAAVGTCRVSHRCLRHVHARVSHRCLGGMCTFRPVTAASWACARRVSHRCLRHVHARVSHRCLRHVHARVSHRCRGHVQGQSPLPWARAGSVTAAVGTCAFGSVTAAVGTCIGAGAAARLAARCRVVNAGAWTWFPRACRDGATRAVVGRGRGVADALRLVDVVRRVGHDEGDLQVLRMWFGRTGTHTRCVAEVLLGILRFGIVRVGGPVRPTLHALFFGMLGIEFERILLLDALCACRSRSASHTARFIESVQACVIPQARTVLIDS